MDSRSRPTPFVSPADRRFPLGSNVDLFSTSTYCLNAGVFISNRSFATLRMTTLHFAVILSVAKDLDISSINFLLL